MSISFNTSVGEIKIELYCEKCPEACEHFLKLCASCFYNKCLFHRVLKNYLIQTGDPLVRSDSVDAVNIDPIDVEPFGDFSEPGIVAFADIGKISSLFFITSVPAPELCGKYTAIGHVIYGLNNVQSISRQMTFEDHFPIRPVCINSVTIHANPLAC